MELMAGTRPQTGRSGSFAFIRKRTWMVATLSLLSAAVPAIRGGGQTSPASTITAIRHLRFDVETCVLSTRVWGLISPHSKSGLPVCFMAGSPLMSAWLSIEIPKPHAPNLSDRSQLTEAPPRQIVISDANRIAKLEKVHAVPDVEFNPEQTGADWDYHARPLRGENSRPGHLPFGEGDAIFNILFIHIDHINRRKT